MNPTETAERLLTREALYVGLSLLTFALAITLIVSPDLIAPSLPEELTDLATPEMATVVLTAGAVVLGGYLFWLLATRHPNETDRDVDPPDASPTETYPVTGAELTSRLEKTITNLQRGDPAEPGALRDDLRERFRTLAKNLGYSEEAVDDLIVSGDWTDDRSAAMFIGGSAVGNYTFVARLRAWLVPGRTFKQRYQRSLRALEEFVEADAGMLSLAEQADHPKHQSVDTRAPLRHAPDRLEWNTRWLGAAFISLTFATAGLFWAESTLFYVALLPLGFIAYAAVTTAPDPVQTLTITRETTTTHPLPGEPVDISLTVTNSGSTAVTDVRLVDGVPDALTVTAGYASGGFSLRAGESRTLQYRLRPQRGTHVFEPTVVRLRSISGATIATAHITPEGPNSLHCAVPVDSVPVHRRTIQRVGSVPTDRGGPGLEFHSTREYRTGDPPRWIDWRRYARTAELGTIRYRRQEATTVVALIDGREVSAVVDQPGTPDGITLSVYASILATGTLLDAGHKVGLVGLGVRVDGNDLYSGPPVYLPPGEVGVHSSRIADVCDTIADPATLRGNPLEPDDIDVDRLHALLPATAQLLVFSPLLDDDIVDTISELRRRGFEITVLSPNVTRRPDYGARVARLDRTIRRTTLMKLGVPVLDWNPDERLHRTLDRLAKQSVLVSQ